jgi:hypothetical protein
MVTRECLDGLARLFRELAQLFSFGSVYVSM